MFVELFDCIEDVFVSFVPGYGLRALNPVRRHEDWAQSWFLCLDVHRKIHKRAMSQSGAIFPQGPDEESLLTL